MKACVRNTLVCSPSPSIVRPDTAIRVDAMLACSMDVAARLDAIDERLRVIEKRLDLTPALPPPPSASPRLRVKTSSL